MIRASAESAPKAEAPATPTVAAIIEQPAVTQIVTGIAPNLPDPAQLKAEQPKAEEPAPEAPAPEPEVPAEEAPALTYDEVAKSVKAAAMRSRAKAMEILASFKIKHLSEAKPSHYPAIKAALDEIVAGAP